MNQEIRFFIGIEAIGLRHSTAVLANIDGRILGAYRLNHGLSLHTTPRDALRCHLLELVKGVASRSGLGIDAVRNSLICVGLTGVTFDFDSHVDLPSQFEQLDLGCPSPICAGDAEIIFAGMVQRDTGTAIICHTGSTAYVSIGDHRQRFGGWGPILGDEGSGYAMGRETLRSIGEEHDRGNDSSLLWQEVRRWLENPCEGNSQIKSNPFVLHPVDDWSSASYRWHKLLDKLPMQNAKPVSLRAAIFAFSHATVRDEGVWAWRSIASSLTIPLFRAYEGGCRQAQGIIERAAEQLVSQHAEACIAAKASPSCGPIVLYGGVITHNPSFRMLIESKLRERWPKEQECFSEVVTVQSPNAMRPACGALLFAMGRSSTSSLKLPSNELANYVRSQVTSWEELYNV